MLHDGLYEQIINKQLNNELSCTDKLIQTAPIDAAEASKVLAKYVAEVVEQGLDRMKDNGGKIDDQIGLVNQLISQVLNRTEEDSGLSDSPCVAERAEQLLALYDKQNTIAYNKLFMLYFLKQDTSVKEHNYA